MCHDTSAVDVAWQPYEQQTCHLNLYTFNAIMHEIFSTTFLSFLAIRHLKRSVSIAISQVYGCVRRTSMHCQTAVVREQAIIWPAVWEAPLAVAWEFDFSICWSSPSFLNSSQLATQQILKSQLVYYTA